jgi:hypothetical protein
VFSRAVHALPDERGVTLVAVVDDVQGVIAQRLAGRVAGP